MWFRATSVAIKLYDGYSWTDWSDWEPCSVNIKMDLSNDIITIFSEKKQIYGVIEVLPAPYDATGEQVKFRIIDQDNDIGNLRLRIEDNGNAQLYVDFANIIWVYNIVRI